MRINLKLLRVKNNLNQSEMADKCSVNRATYSYIETGKRDGNAKFWERLKNEFNISDTEMYSYMKKE